MHRLLRLWHTVRYLRPAQIFGRIVFKLYRPSIDLSPAPDIRRMQGFWVLPAVRQASMLGPDLFRFLNQTHRLYDWDDRSLSKLWRYNLHYFDDLNAEAAMLRIDWHRGLIKRWVLDNAPGQGTGWEPYPTSLRIVNWIKWVLAGNALQPQALQSLAVQARWLAKRLEFHLLGNHLFSNAKALVFAGLFFEGPEASHWLNQGLKILAREVSEQILADGGHFERSPMYHALLLEDRLDLINLMRAYRKSFPKQLDVGFEKLDGMLLWLAAMCHPDGDISFFNDASIGIAPSLADLSAYAARLGLKLASIQEGVTHLAQTGYVRVQRGAMVALLDVAPIGPDYLPGHAHADTLSFELSLFGRRVIVNSGASCYGVDAERLRQRSTAAHNTVAIDGEDSSEVWGSFRVARRARPFGLCIEEGVESRIVCSHDGYARLPGKPVHSREWRFYEGGMEILDCIEGDFNEARAYLFFAPDAVFSGLNSADEGSVRWADGVSIQWRVEGAQVVMKPATYHPGFGLTQLNHGLQMRFKQARCSLRLTWNQDAHFISNR